MPDASTYRSAAGTATVEAVRNVMIETAWRITNGLRPSNDRACFRLAADTSEALREVQRPARVTQSGEIARGARVACHPRGSDRKSTRLNSSHANISYAVFCLKKKISVLPSPDSSFSHHLRLHL